MKTPKSLSTINLGAVLRKQGVYEKQTEYLELKKAALPIARKIVKSRQVKSTPPQNPTHTQFTNDEVLGYWEKQIHIVEVMEKKFDHKVQQFIGKVVDGFLQHLDSEIATNKSLAKTKDFFDDNEDDLMTQAELDFTPLLTDVAVLAGQEAYDLVHSKEIYTSADIRKQISENVAKFTQSMLDTDRQTLIDLITNGLTNGQSIPEIRGEIVTKFDAMSKTQAQRITRTEVLRASNQASLDAYRESGVVEGLQWLTAGATDECAQYEGQVVALEGDFYSSEGEFEDGYPPLHPNCRCVVLPVLIGEKAAMTGIFERRDAVAELTKEIEELRKYTTELEKISGIDE